TIHRGRRLSVSPHTDEQGVVVLAVLPGEIEVTAGWKPIGMQRRTLRVAAGEARTIEFRLARTGQLDGVVRDRRGQPVSGARVRLKVLDAREPTVRSESDVP